jgi:hypothetical protein
MKARRFSPVPLLLAAGVLSPGLGFAGVSADEAQHLKDSLTPYGAERAGNKEGTIPAWTGGDAKPPAGYKTTDRRTDPRAGDKILYSITSKNMDQYADKLSDGVKAMLKKYPTYRVDVYPTHRTFAAPQYVYDNTFRNATRATLKEGGAYPMPAGAYGGPPFPVPKTGIEIVWNHLMRYQGANVRNTGGQNWMVTADGKKVMTVEGFQEIRMPYYDPNGSPEKFDGYYWLTRVGNYGPPIRAGEAIVGRVNIDDAKTLAWVYLTGQRRVRKLPNPSGDTPTPASAGVMTFDELNVFNAQPGYFNWKLVGKKEMLIPYNNNKILQPKSAEEVMQASHLNPDYVRWELHRVWVVDAELAPGKRHSAPKGRYYFDEDSWLAVLGDRWDAKGQLWKTLFGLPMVLPEFPLMDHVLYGFYDLISGAWCGGPYQNSPTATTTQKAELKDELFTPDAMVGDQLR